VNVRSGHPNTRLWTAGLHFESGPFRLTETVCAKVTGKASIARRQSLPFPSAPALRWRLRPRGLLINGVLGRHLRRFFGHPSYLRCSRAEQEGDVVLTQRLLAHRFAIPTGAGGRGRCGFSAEMKRTFVECLHDTVRLPFDLWGNRFCARLFLGIALCIQFASGLRALLWGRFSRSLLLSGLDEIEKCHTPL
jgi:hypothetical protein